MPGLDAEDVLLRRLADKILELLAYWDAGLRCRFANPACEQWFGVEPGALIGRHVSEVPGPTHGLDMAHIEAALRGEYQEFELDLALPGGGAPRPSTARYYPDVIDGVVRGFFFLVTDESMLKRAERERQVFISLLENSRDFIGITDPNGKPIYVNPAGRRMVGLAPDFPVETLTIPDFYPPEEHDFAAAVPQKLRTIGRWFGETHVYNRKSGESIPVSDEHFAIRDPQGERILGMGAIIRDITEARAASDRLRESEERFRLTFEVAPIGIALVGLDGTFLSLNPAFGKIVGYRPEELVGRTFQDITHPDDLQTDIGVLRRLVRGELRDVELEKRYVRKDGEVVDAALSIGVVRDRNGKPRYFVSQIEDITEQKRFEHQQRFLAEVGPVLATTLEYEETITRIAELAVRDLADLCFVDVVDEDGAHKIKVVSRDPAQRWICSVLKEVSLDHVTLVRTALDTRKPILVERITDEMVKSLARSAEHLRALRAADIGSLVAVPLLAHGKVLGSIALAAARTSRPFGPADVRLAEDLARRAALSIENARLYRSAQRAIRARDDVMGIVAHDLRNPLGVIRMQLSALRRPGPHPERRSGKAADAIDRASRRMNRLIEDLLDVARMEAGGLSIHPGPVSAARVVQEAVDAQQPLAAAASVELKRELSENLPELWADRDRLLQVLENLMGNALKFTPSGGRIIVGAAPVHGGVLFHVSDTGKGIAAEDQPHLFDRFFQARAERSGAGLGLQIVKGIIDAHHGRVWVESAPGQGSSFFFIVPSVKGAGAWREESARE